MLALTLPLLVAILAGHAAGGSLWNLARVRVRAWIFLIGAFGVELVLYNPPVSYTPWARQWGSWVWVGTELVMLGVALVNAADGQRVLSAWTLVAAGLALNALVIAANGGYMPQSEEAARAVWGVQAIPMDERLTNVRPMTPASRLPFLGDVIPEPRLLGRANVVSAGDVLISFGAAWLVFGWVTGSGWSTGRRVALPAKDET